VRSEEEEASAAFQQGTGELQGGKGERSNEADGGEDRVRKMMQRKGVEERGALEREGSRCGRWRSTKESVTDSTNLHVVAGKCFQAGVEECERHNGGTNLELDQLSYVLDGLALKKVRKGGREGGRERGHGSRCRSSRRNRNVVDRSSSFSFQNGRL
jgi:hypothetical protein